jgi:prevent-host-death family protein
MQTTTFTNFRQKAKDYFDAVERGEIVRISRHGKVVAELVPASEGVLPRWKRPGIRLKIDGVSLSEEIIRDRRKAER